MTRRGGFDPLKWAASLEDAIPPADRLVLVALASFANADGFCFPSIDKITKRASLKPRAIISAIASLERGGYLSVKHGRGRGIASEYRLNFGKSHEKPPENMHQMHINGLDQPQKHAPDAPFVAPENMHLTTIKGAPDAPQLLKELPKEERTLTTFGAPADADPAQAAVLKIWTDGLQEVMRITGKPDPACRKLLGRMMKAARGDAAGLWLAIGRCPYTGDPEGWLMGAALALVPARLNATDAAMDKMGIGSMLLGSLAASPTVVPFARRIAS